MYRNSPFLGKYANRCQARSLYRKKRIINFYLVLNRGYIYLFTMEEFFDSDNFSYSQTNVSFEELYGYINAIPALFWTIDIVKNKIEYLNKYALPGLGENSTLIIKNPDFTYSIILEEDRYIFENFIKSIRARRPGLAVFRVRAYDGTIRWLKIAGNHDVYRSHYYVGYILEVTETADFIRSIDHSESGIIKRINLFDNPVVLFNFSDKRLVACNTAFENTFSIKPGPDSTIIFNDIILESAHNNLNSIYEDIIFSGRWKGELVFRKNGALFFSSDAAIRPIYAEGRNLLWLSIYNMLPKTISGSSSLTPSPLRTPDIDFIKKEVLAAAKRGSLIKMLEVFLENQPFENLADAVLYSDIHSDEGMVIVSGAGKSFSSLKPGISYPYEGTIAENIVNYNLEYLIVDNTFESIKPIDWALFIPNGIKSYFAVPFYENNILRTVLIFCSVKTDSFNTDIISAYKPFFPLFLDGLAVIKSRI